jgi:hypothetical protein
MRTFKIALAAALALASSVAMSQGIGTGITGTKHDWSAPVNAAGTSGGQSLLVWCTNATCTGAVAPTGNVLGANTTTYNTGYAFTDASGAQYKNRVQFGLCTKCHTAHKAKSTNLLWNHTLSTNNFAWDQPNTTGGTNYAAFSGDTYKGPTTKCLSCHDGSLASTDGVWFNRQYVSGSPYVCTPSATNLCLDSGHEVGEHGHMAGTHPVAMPYPVNGAGSTYNGSTTGDEVVASEFVANPTSAGIRLFNDDGSGNIIAGVVDTKTGMECTSCHDIHNGAATKDVMLLRGKLAGGKADGYICTQCHIK